MRARCGRCGSRRWRRDPTGVLVCEQGHQYTVEEQFDEEGMDRSQRKRVYKRKRSRSVAAADSEMRLRSLSVQLEECMYILRMQAEHLVRERGCPEELLTTARDLWLMYVSTENAFSLSQAAPKRKNLFEIMWLRHGGLSLVVCRLACRILGIPILLGDLRQWVCDGSLPYMDATYRLPLEIRRHFKLEDTSRRRPPSHHTLAKQHSVLIKLLASRFGVHFPDPFPPSLVMRFMSDLKIPVSVYPHFKAIRWLCENQTMTQRQPEYSAAACFLVAIKTAMCSSIEHPIPLPDDAVYHKLHSLMPPSTTELDSSFGKPGRNAWRESVQGWIPKQNLAIVSAFDELVTSNEVLQRRGQPCLVHMPAAPPASADAARPVAATSANNSGSSQEPATAMHRNRGACGHEPQSMEFYPLQHADPEGAWPVQFGVCFQYCVTHFVLERDELLSHIVRLEYFLARRSL
ncbi:hypothetical protein HK105_205037 [Polyrhizophydium stewartii]|uniref:RRN7-type domain-containing protein n=1 Tax=Polyrhizophydium stewartii TaxID=2732419 RepID=A0ABR4N7I2_9FUNG